MKIDHEFLFSFITGVIAAAGVIAAVLLLAWVAR